jgi:uncharacterized membrane protein YfcA
VVRLAAIGLVAGVFSALFGVGGGIIVVPLLTIFCRYDARRAAATSLAAIGITALAGTISYAAHGHVRVYDALLLGIPAAVGAVAGAVLQQRLHLHVLTLLFGLLLALVGVKLIAPGAFAFGAIQHRDAWVYVLAVAIGAFAGLVAGLFGVGGGILFVPTLVLALGLSQLHAEATSLLAILPTVIAGTLRQRRYGNVEWHAALVVGVASVAGVQGGIAIAESLREATLQRLFGVLLLLTAAQIAWRGLRAGAVGGLRP